MEGNFGVFLENSAIGKAQILEEGLYYRICCRCQLPNQEMYRLSLRCGDSQENLGILVPMGDGFGLDTRVPKKRLEEGEPSFWVTPKQPHSEEKFVPIYPEEPFAYMEKVKDGYLARKDGQIGLVMKKP